MNILASRAQRFKPYVFCSSMKNNFLRTLHVIQDSSPQRKMFNGEPIRMPDIEQLMQVWPAEFEEFGNRPGICLCHCQR